MSSMGNAECVDARCDWVKIEEEDGPRFIQRNYLERLISEGEVSVATMQKAEPVVLEDEEPEPAPELRQTKALDPYSSEANLLWYARKGK